MILEPVSAYVMLMCCKQNSQEIPEDGVDKRRKASKLK